MKEEGMSQEKQFIRAYDLYADQLFRHCFIRVSNRERAMDLMQDTFIRTWEYIQKGKDIENIRAFLYRTAHNLIVDTYRKKKELSLDELREDGFDPAKNETEHIQNAADAKKALEYIQKLDLSYQEVVTMRYVDELSPSEIAAILGETENAVSVRIHRGIQKLKTLLQQS